MQIVFMIISILFFISGIFVWIKIGKIAKEQINLEKRINALSDAMKRMDDGL